MGRNQTFTLLEATLALYPAGADGEPLLDFPVWMGACAENLRLRSRLEEHITHPTGERYGRTYHTDEEHLIEINRLWVLQLSDLRDYALARNQTYVLEVVWQDEFTEVWHKRKYCGVTAQNYDLSSEGVMQFMADQGFRAQRYVQSAGFGVYTPLATTPPDQNVGFFHDGPVASGDYFLGHYNWGRDVELVSAKVIAEASQVDPTELTLEVAGSLTAHVIEIPAGSVGQEVTDTLAFSGVFVSAGQTVRWKVTDAPGSGQAAMAAVVLRVR